MLPQQLHDGMQLHGTILEVADCHRTVQMSLHQQDSSVAASSVAASRPAVTLEQSFLTADNERFILCSPV